jgi:tripartite-type tricarboxylate transporter receptor subunit TctC
MGASVAQPGERILGAFAGLVLATAALAAEAPERFPSKTIHIVLPFTPGGGTDILARKLAPGMQQRLGQSVVIENKPGSNARIGANYVAKAEPDSYTILLTTNGAFTIAPFIGGKPPYDSLKDFAPVTLVARSPVLMVAGPKSPIRTVTELIDAARRAPGKLTYASSGIGGPPHLATEMLKQAAGIDMLMVPYGGTGDVNVALLRGDVDVAVGALAAVLPLLQQKDVKALAVTSAKRSPTLPDVPAVAETVPGFDVVSWFAIAAPAGTPRPVIDKLRTAALGALNEPAVVEALARDGAEIAISTPEEMGALMAADYAKYGAVVKSLNLKE